MVFNFILRSISRYYGYYLSGTAGAVVGYKVTEKNLTDVRQVVSKDILEITDDKGVPHVHVERKLQFLSLLPLRTVSRCFGHLASVELPNFVLQPLLREYSKMYDVNLDEAVDPDIKSYKSLGSFFNRDIKKSCRPIDKSADLISPCDGRVLAVGRASAVEARQGHFKVEQVKGVTFSLSSFLGSPLPTVMKEKLHPDSDLFYCTIYLAPGDFHGFVAPADWLVQMRRHFSGRLFSVKPSLAQVVRPLFTLNERVVYTGKWQHGFFSLSAIGATNVGNIVIDFDKELQTNRRKYERPFLEKSFQSENRENDLLFKRGDVFGRFSLGSTIVLIFEAPKSSKFTLEPGDRVLIGQPLTDIVNTNAKQ